MRYVLVMLGSLVGLVIVAYLLLYLLISVGCMYLSGELCRAKD